MTAWLWILALGNLASAAWVLLAPGHWYANLPARVPDFGPANTHFLRDIGVAQLTMGVALVWAARRPALRLPLVGVVTVFFTAHALVHVLDTARGHVGAAHWWIDFPTSYLPALVLLGIMAALRRQRAVGD